MNTYRCSTCGKDFETKRALGGHRSRGVCKTIVNLTTARATTTIARSHVITTPVEVAAHFVHYTNCDNQPDVATFSVTQLLQRPIKADATHTVVPARVSRPLFRCDTVNTYRLHEVANMYN